MGDDIVYSAWGHAAVHKRTGKVVAYLVEYKDAFLYGSGIANLAAVCGVTEKEMREVVARFEIELPSLARLREKVIEQGNKYGYLQAPDGHWGRIRMSGGELKEHTMLNVLLQMTGSLCMKYALVKAFAVMRKEGVGLDDNGHPAGVANVHKHHCAHVE